MEMRVPRIIVRCCCSSTQYFQFMSCSLPYLILSIKNTRVQSHAVISAKSEDLLREIEQWHFAREYISDPVYIQSDVFSEYDPTISSNVEDETVAQCSNIFSRINASLRDSESSRNEFVHNCDLKKKMRTILTPISAVQSDSTFDYTNFIFHTKAFRGSDIKSSSIPSGTVGTVDYPINGRKDVHSLDDTTDFNSLNNSSNGSNFGVKYHPQMFTSIVVNTQIELVSSEFLKSDCPLQIQPENLLENGFQNEDEGIIFEHTSSQSSKLTSTEKFRTDLAAVFSSPYKPNGESLSFSTCLASENNISTQSMPNFRHFTDTITKTSEKGTNHVPKLSYKLLSDKSTPSQVIVGEKDQLANFPESKARTFSTSLLDTKKPSDGLSSVNSYSGEVDVIGPQASLEHNSGKNFPDMRVLLKTKKKEWNFKSPEIIRALYIESETDLLGQWKSKYARVRQPNSSRIQNNRSSMLRKNYLQYKRYKTSEETMEMDRLRQPSSRKMPDFKPVRIQSTLTSEYRHAFARNRPPIPYHYLEYFKAHKKLPFKIVQTKKTDSQRHRTK